jgi:tetratricopeptide (TPR) repeat protein
MDKSRQKQPKVSLFQRIAIILCGLLVVVLALEIGLRVSGFIMLSLQEHKNLQSIKEQGSCRIMCLGESTTQRQYPPHLENILNQRNIGIEFSVIDKGLAHTTTVAILLELEKNLDKYQPDIVVAMMGCNDGKTMYYRDIPEADTWLFRHCRVYRFSQIICMHILKKLKKEDIYSVNRPTPELKNSYCNHSKPLEVEKSSKKITEFNSQDDSEYIRLGGVYQEQGRLIEAEQALKKAIELNPKKDIAYVELGRLYRYQGKLSQAEDLFKKVIELNPENDNTYVELGMIYRASGKQPSQAEDAFKKAIELNPENDNAYFMLGGLYRDQGKLSLAEDSSKKAIELNPENDNANIFLGWFYREQGKFSQAEEVFKKAIGLNPKNDNAYRAISALYEEIGKPKLAKEYAQKANKLRFQYCALTTVNNYRKLKEILDKRKIKLVCVQYPVRSIQPLKKIFKEDDDVVFVDNERIFKDAVRKEGYNAYFVDMFGGDFGHCTEKGNRLLAQNIANAILKEVFNK